MKHFADTEKDEKAEKIIRRREAMWRMANVAQLNKKKKDGKSETGLQQKKSDRSLTENGDLSNLDQSKNKSIASFNGIKGGEEVDQPRNGIAKDNSTEPGINILDNATATEKSQNTQVTATGINDPVSTSTDNGTGLISNTGDATKDGTDLSNNVADKEVKTPSTDIPPADSDDMQDDATIENDTEEETGEVAETSTENSAEEDTGGETESDKNNVAKEEAPGKDKPQPTGESNTAGTETIEEELPAPLSEADLAQIEEAKTNLLAVAAATKTLVLNETFLKKEFLAQQANDKIAAIEAQKAERIAQVKSSFAATRRSINNEATACRVVLDKGLANSIDQVRKNTKLKSGLLGDEIQKRKDDFATYVSEQENEPFRIAQEEGERAGRELDAAARQAIVVGERVASRYKNGDKAAEQQEAARKVAQDSANDILDKKEPIAQQLMQEALNFGGNYNQYSAEIIKQLNETYRSLLPALKEIETKTITKLKTTHAGNVTALNKQKQEQLNRASAAEKATINKLNKESKASIAIVNQNVAASTALLDQASAKVLQGIDESAQATIAAANTEGATVEDKDYLLSTLNEGSTGITNAGAATGAVMQGIIDPGLAAMQQAGEAFDTKSASLSERGKGLALNIKQAGKTAMKQLHEAYTLLMQTTVEQTATGQQKLIDDGLKKVDESIKDRKAKLVEISDKFRETLKPTTDEAVTEAKTPLTDDLYGRANEAAIDAGKSWLEGALEAVGKFLLVLIIIIAAVVLIAILATVGGIIGAICAAIMAVLTVIMEAVLIVALVSLAISTIIATYGRMKQGLGFWDALGRGFLDATGITGMQEAYSGVDAVTGEKLSDYERGKRGTEGGLTLIMNLLPFLKIGKAGGFKNAFKIPKGGGAKITAAYTQGKVASPKWGGINSPNKGITINTAADIGDNTLQPLSSLSKRQLSILDKLPKQGDYVFLPKNDVAMKDLLRLTNATGDEFNMFTKGGQRLIMRGITNSKGQKVINVPDEQFYDDLIAGKYGKFSGHTHPPGGTVSPGLGDRPFLTSMGQKQSGIWGNTAEKPYVFGRIPADDYVYPAIEKSQNYYDDIEW